MLDITPEQLPPLSIHRPTGQTETSESRGRESTSGSLSITDRQTGVTGSPLAEFAHKQPRSFSHEEKSVHGTIWPQPANYPRLSSSNSIHESCSRRLRENHDLPSTKKPKKPSMRPREKMKKQYDKGKRPARNLQIGDHVWLDSTNLSLPRPKKKLDEQACRTFQNHRKGRSLSLQAWNSHLIGKSIRSFNEKLLNPVHPTNIP